MTVYDGTFPTTIRIHNYMSDVDARCAINLIGPYPDVDAAVADIQRFMTIPEMDEACAFEVMNVISPEMVEPAKLVDVADLQTFSDIAIRNWG